MSETMRPKEWMTLVVVPIASVVVAVGGAAFVVGSLSQRVAVLEEVVAELKEASTSPVVFGEWQLMAHSKEHRAETDGVVVVRSHGDSGPAENDFEVLVEMGGELWPFTRGGAYQGAAVPVPKGRRWAVKRGASSENGSMSVHWLPLVTGDAARGSGVRERE